MARRIAPESLIRLIQQFRPEAAGLGIHMYVGHTKKPVPEGLVLVVAYLDKFCFFESCVCTVLGDSSHCCS